MIEMTRSEVEQYLDDCRIGRLGMAGADGHPYVIPLPFCWMDGALYLRLSMTGRKGETLAENNRVCFEVDSYTDDFAEYASVLIEGRLGMVESVDEKARVRELNDSKYLRLRRGFRPGHGRATALEALPLQKIVVEKISGRKKTPAATSTAIPWRAAGE
ncbi:MAG TPA: pyridoxamine 5'-phosphate oxidase family protein [Planctomycetota bacterium]|nr:pyridoxamine 5'-phosphate oxidase family protein [Planctomycetota bacterium]